jgi:hypothetical protein
LRRAVAAARSRSQAHDEHLRSGQHPAPQRITLHGKSKRVWILELNKDSIASWQPRPGRNPYDRGSNRASHSGSSAFRTRA